MSEANRQPDLLCFLHGFCGPRMEVTHCFQCSITAVRQDPPGQLWLPIISHALSLETLFPSSQPLLPLSQAVQDKWPPPFVLNSSELPRASLENTHVLLPPCSCLFLYLCLPSLPGLTGTLASHGKKHTNKLVPWYLITFLSYSHD
jgi:hypothetical protein